MNGLNVRVRDYTITALSYLAYQKRDRRNTTKQPCLSRNGSL